MAPTQAASPNALRLAPFIFFIRSKIQAGQTESKVNQGAMIATGRTKQERRDSVAPFLVFVELSG
jgi:hypothetical protein